MMRIENQLYKIHRIYGSSEFVEAANVNEVAEYVAQCTKRGDVITSITEVNLDGSHPRVAVAKTKAYKDAMK